jgi:hypothetical protein
LILYLNRRSNWRSSAFTSEPTNLDVVILSNCPVGW